MMSRRRFLAGSVALGAASAVEVPAATPAAPDPFVGGSAAALSRAATLGIANIAREGLTDVFPRPFEVDLLASDRRLRKTVALRAMEIIEASPMDLGRFSPIELVETPKKQYGARRLCAYIAPLDTAVYLALALLAAPAIERHRIPAGDGVVFSYRFVAGNGRIFHRKYNHSGFIDAGRLMADDSAFAVHADIADFYGSIRPRVLDRALHGSGIGPDVRARLAALLDYWSEQKQVGLPVGSNASRILAEAVLSPIDHALRREGIQFVRFVDDYAMYATDRAGAARALEALADLLAGSKLALNPGKTKIDQVSPARPPGDATSEPSGAPPLAPGTEPTLRLARGHKPRRPSGVNPTIPQNFRKPRGRELGIIRQAAEPRVEPLLTGELAPAWLVRRSIRFAVYGGHTDFVARIPEILARYPEFSRYAVGALAQGAGELAPDLRRQLSGRFSRMLADPCLPTFVALNVIALLGSAGYENRTAIAAYARTCSPEPRGIGLRTALDALRRTGEIPSDLLALSEAGDGWGHGRMRAGSAAGNLIPSVDERENGTAVDAGRGEAAGRPQNA